MTYKVLYIDVTNEVVTQRACTCHKDLQQLVGGPIEIALRWKNGDTVYVDEGGLSKVTTDSRGFELDGQQFVGNGVVVGREETEELDDDDVTIQHDPSIPLERLRERVHFLAVRIKR